MNSRQGWVERRQSLRTQAEGMLDGISAPDADAPPTNIIMHELLVHKIELEMQVEELRRARDTMEEARDRYLELYDFAPVGCITLNRGGLITEINLNGAALLRSDRITLVHARFAHVVTPTYQDFWHRLFMNLMQQAEPGQQSFVFELVRGDGSTFHAYLDCQRRQGGEDAPLLRLAVFDISRIKEAEQRMREATAGFFIPPDSLAHHD